MFFVHDGGQTSISIHALREEGDDGGQGLAAAHLKFLSTPSARRATASNFMEDKDGNKFLSTPSARRATGCLLGVFHPGAYFYPRPPRGGRLTAPPGQLEPVCISIHALREEGDVAAVQWGRLR